MKQSQSAADEIATLPLVALPNPIGLHTHLLGDGERGVFSCARSDHFPLFSPGMTLRTTWKPKSFLMAPWNGSQ